MGRGRPYVLRAAGPGRPLEDPRARLDAILHIAVSGEPWRALPGHFGKPATISRHFRRLAHAGLWSRLLQALADPAAPPALRAVEYWLCRAARRAMRLLRMAGVMLARRLGLLTALPMLPWMMPDPDLPESLHSYTCDVMDLWPKHRPRPGLLTLIGRLLARAGGRRTWSKRFAPP